MEGESLVQRQVLSSGAIEAYQGCQSSKRTMKLLPDDDNGKEEVTSTQNTCL